MNIKISLAKYSRDVGVLETLSRDGDVEVRSKVAQNINTSPHILEVLSRDENFYVRGRVARNSNTPQHILEALSRDRDQYVLYWANVTLKKKDKV